MLKRTAPIPTAPRRPRLVRRQKIELWRRDYNEVRPAPADVQGSQFSATGGLTLRILCREIEQPTRLLNTAAAGPPGSSALNPVRLAPPTNCYGELFVNPVRSNVAVAFVPSLLSYLPGRNRSSEFGGIGMSCVGM